MNEYLEFAIEIAKYAKETMLRYFYLDKESSYKEDNTIVTMVDKKINKYLISEVKKRYPTHCVYGEEEKYGESEYEWICDPIDGTAMYARQIPVAVFSLALAINGEPVIGVILDPYTDSIYTAIKENGAYKNNKKINVNNKTLDNMRTIIHYDIWPSAEYDIIDVIRDLNKKTYTVSIGSVIRAALCVAEGNFNGIVFPGTKGKNCDIAAVKVIVEEAGGIVTDLFGDNQQYDKDINGAVISNGVIHEELINTVKKYVVNRKNNIEIYNLKDKKEYLKEVIILEHKEWAKNPDNNFEERINKKCQEVEKLLEKNDYCKLLLLINDELIGFISIFPQDCDEEPELTPWYSTMYVKDNHRKKGYSRILNNAILEEARKRGFKELYLKSELSNYYEKFGAQYIKNINETEKLYKIVIN